MPDAAATSAEKPAIRAAATIILWRQGGAKGPEVLMGQRGAKAAFMPSKYVFPGGAVDPADQKVLLAQPVEARSARRLALESDLSPQTIAAAAIRELWEETGLAMGVAGKWPAPVPKDRDHDWQGFAARGLVPSAAGLRFLFRAITPPGRSRRFDARFFLASATSVAGNIDDFSAASDELSHLHWIALADARSLDLPFITEVVLAEAGSLLKRGAPEAGVPFFDNSGPTPRFRWLV